MEQDGRVPFAESHPSRDDEIDFYDDDSEWCDRCQGLGTAECHCGGDQCYCENYGEMECPTCHGEGRWTPTPAQIADRAETARWWAEFNARLREGIANNEPLSGNNKDVRG